MKLLTDYYNQMISIHLVGILPFPAMISLLVVSVSFFDPPILSFFLFLCLNFFLSFIGCLFICLFVCFFLSFFLSFFVFPSFCYIFLFVCLFLVQKKMDRPANRQMFFKAMKELLSLCCSISEAKNLFFENARTLR